MKRSRRPFHSLGWIGFVSLVLVACMQGGGPQPDPSPTSDLSIGAPFDGQTLAGTVIAVAGGVGGSARDLSFTLGDLRVDADPDGTAILNTRTLDDGEYTLRASATVDGDDVSDAITVTVRNDVSSSGTVGPDGGTLKSGEGSYATLPPGALDGSATLTLEDTTQGQILAEFGVDYPALGVTFLGSLTVDASGTSTVGTDLPVQVDLAGWAQAVQPGQDVVMFNVLPDADGNGVGELTFAASARATPDGSVVTNPAIGMEIYGFGAAGDSLRLQQAAAVRPGQLVTLQGRGLTPHSVLGNTAAFDGGFAILVAADDLETDAYSPLQSVVMAVPALGRGEHRFTLHNGSTGFRSAPFALEVGDLGSGDPSTWNAFLEQLDTAIDGVTEGRDGLRALATSFRGSLADDATLRAMVANSGLVDGGNLALLQQIGSAGYSAEQRELVVRHALLLDALAASAPSIAASAADLASLLMVASPAVDESSLPGVRSQQAGGSCSGPSAPVFWGSPTGMGSAPPGSCAGGGAAGGGGSGSPLRGQRLGSYGAVEGAVIKVEMLDGSGLRSPFTAVSDEVGQFYLPFLAPGEPYRVVAFDPATGDTAEAVGMAGGVDELKRIDLAFAPDQGGPGDPVASFTATETGFGVFAFDASASFDPDGEIVEYFWNFGDGEVVSSWFGEEHDYLFGGTFTVTLTVFDDEGNVAAAHRTVEIEAVYDIELIRDHASEPALGRNGELVGFVAPLDSSFTEFGGVIVVDTVTGIATRVDVADDGEAANDWGFRPEIGGDGRYVLFETLATNLSPTPATTYLRDLETGTLIPIDAALVGGTDECVRAPTLSGNGRHVGLLLDEQCGTSSFSRVVAYLADLEAGTSVQLNTLADGTPASPQRARGEIVLDADGDVPLFGHEDADLVVGDDNGANDTFRKHLDDGAVELVTIRPDGGQFDWTGLGSDGALSDDGTLFLFTANDGVANEVYLHDLAADTVTKISVRADGSEFSMGSGLGSSGVRISGDGRYALYYGHFDDPGGTGESFGLVVKDLVGGDIAWVDHTDLGKAPRSVWQGGIAISGDGRWIAFEAYPLTAEAEPDSFGVYRVQNPLWE